MCKAIFSDGFELDKFPMPSKDYRQYKYRLAELFETQLTPIEAKYYRQRLRKQDIKATALLYWASIPKGSTKAIHGDTLEKLSDALGIPMRDLKYRD